MKKTIITLLALAGMTSAADKIQIDFGRYDSQTADYYNIHTAKDFTTSFNANYIDGATSNTSTHSLTLDEIAIGVTYTHATGTTNSSGHGLVPTLTTSEEDGWKNAFTGELPKGVSGSVYDGLTTQAAGNAGYHTLTFTGLTAGTYTLSVFGGYYGNDDMSNMSVSLGNGLVADWTISTYSDTWVTNPSVAGNSSITLSGDNTDNVNHGYYFVADSIEVGEDGTLSFTISGSDAWKRTPLNYVSLQMVPEPTTATLSLLALAGLAARRRRK